MSSTRTTIKSIDKRTSNVNETVALEGEEEDIWTLYQLSLFDLALPAVCRKFNSAVNVFVEKFQQNDNMKQFRSSGEVRGAESDTSGTFESDFVTPSSSLYLKDCIVVKSIYDADGKLIEVIFKDIKKMDLTIVQVVGLLAPLYTKLSKITFNNTTLKVCIITELQKFLSFTNINEVNFENLYFKEANYSILLDHPVRLINYTIKGCHINDEVCKQIASKLTCDAPAGNILKVLNLSSNQITDIGARYLAEVIRTNRCLRYLNLANNRLSDEGAAYILNYLQGYQMEDDEIKEKRKRLFKFLESEPQQQQQAQQEKKSFSADLTAKENPIPVYCTNKNLEIRDGRTFILGNFVLCYLNISFNNLTYFTLKKIIEVLSYQSEKLDINDKGLIKIVMQGNNLPNHCEEVMTINSYLSKNISRRQFAQSTIKK